MVVEVITPFKVTDSTRLARQVLIEKSLKKKEDKRSYGECEKVHAIQARGYKKTPPPYTV